MFAKEGTGNFDARLETSLVYLAFSTLQVEAV